MTQSTRWSEFARAVLALYAPNIRRPATRAKLCQVLTELRSLCPDTLALTPGTVAAWIAGHPDRSPATTLSLLRTLRTAVRWGSTLGLVPADPFACRPPRAWFPAGALRSEDRRRHHSAADIARVLALADSEALGGPWRARRRRAVIYMAAYTGARAREILGARTVDYEAESGVLWIRPNARRPLKTAGSAAPLPVCEPLRAVLEAWIPESGSSGWLFPGTRGAGPWLGGAPGYRPVDRVRQLGERAGVEGLTLLSLRHSFATLAESWGLGPLMLQRLLRHSRVETQRHYRHADPTAMREAVGLIRY